MTTDQRRPLHHCLAVCAPGIEEICAVELTALGIKLRRTLRGGVEFSATDRQLYSANLWSRTATRIVVRVASFRATAFDVLEREIAAVDWAPFIAPGRRPSVRVSSTSSRLYHTDAIGDRVAAVIGGEAREETAPLVVVRVMHDRVMVSVDSSGDPLFRRGWRTDGAKAPIRETLAAAMIAASGWDRSAPFLDPMCGSGTIAIEAALAAAGRPPGEGRRFAFMDWPSFAPGTWASVGATSREASSAAPTIVASDRDRVAVDAATANAARAGVAGVVDIRHVAVAAVDPPADHGWLVTNPPYGKRVGGDLGALYTTLGLRAQNDFAGWTVGLLLADDRLARRTALALEPVFSSENGGIDVRFSVAKPRRLTLP